MKLAFDGAFALRIGEFEGIRLWLDGKHRDITSMSKHKRIFRLTLPLDPFTRHVPGQRFIYRHQTPNHHCLVYAGIYLLVVRAMAPRKEKTEKATADQGGDSRPFIS